MTEPQHSAPLGTRMRNQTDTLLQTLRTDVVLALQADEYTSWSSRAMLAERLDELEEAVEQVREELAQATVRARLGRTAN